MGELAIVKNCIMQLYNVLLPGKFPQPAAQAPPPQQAPPLLHLQQQQPPTPQPAQLLPHPAHHYHRMHPHAAPQPPQLRGVPATPALQPAGQPHSACHQVACWPRWLQ